MARRTGLVAIIAIVGALALGVLASVGAAGGDRGKSHKSKSMEAKLTGFEEVPAVLSNGKGKLKLKTKNSTSIEFKLTYSGLSGPAAAAHIHFAQTGVNSGIAAFLCGAPKPACPTTGTTSKATVEGTILPADVLALPAQGLAAGDLAGLVKIMKAGAAYANVHTAAFPNGEIRGQVDRKGDRRGDDD